MAQEQEKQYKESRKWRGHSGGGGLAGVVWVIGWLFTIGYAHLVWWQIILGIVVWPYYLSLVVK